MAAGDLRFKIKEIRVVPGKEVMFEYGYGIEDKRGNVDFRHNTMAVSWDNFKSFLTAQERGAVQTIKDVARDILVASDVTRFGGAIEDSN